MRKMRIIKLVALLVLTAALPLHAVDGSIGYTATYDYTRLTIGERTINNTTYATVAYNGLYNSGVPGTPSLPIEYLKFSVPYNATNFSVTATPGNTDAVLLSHTLFPCQEHITGTPFTSPDVNAYSGEYPSSLAWIVSEGYLAGENHIVTVAVMPISHQVDQGTGDVSIVKHGSISLSLDYDISSSTVKVLLRNDTALRRKGFELAKRRVVNPQSVENFAYYRNPDMLRLEHDEWDTGTFSCETDAVNYPYIIVTTDALVHSMRRIAALKRQQGINVKVVTVTEAINSECALTGDYLPYSTSPYYTDDAGKLRQFLRHHFNKHGTEYVLLAGSGIPDRYSYDIYFCDLDQDWTDFTDPEGDLFVGRLLGEDPESFDNYTDKLFRYELNPGHGDYSYLRRALLTSDYQNSTLYSGMTDMLPDVTVMDEADMVDALTGCDLIDSISVNHYGFWGAFDNGTPSYLKIFDGDGEQPSHYIWAIDTVKVSPVTITDTENGNGINRMLNKYYPMICCVTAGMTIPFTNVSGFGNDMNVGESFTMGKDYGGPVYMGLSHNTMYTTPSLYFTYKFADVFSTCRTVGEAFAEAKGVLYDNIESGDYLRYMNYLGDPGVCVWSDTPSEYWGCTVTRRDSSVTVFRIPTPSTVSYCSNDGSIGSVEVSSSSVTLNNVSPNSSIMVRRPGYIPYITPMVLQNTTLSNSQYVLARNVKAGRSVDNNRTSGPVTVSSGIEYEIEATGPVWLHGGFKVEKGATFIVHKPSF